MKISIAYPPLESEKGIPLLSQNRQFQWFNAPTYIYPMVPAYAATLLKEDGHEVFWDDGIAEEKTYQDWLRNIMEQKPDLIAIETKTPVIKRHWEIINELKSLSAAHYSPLTVLMGDHVTALPKESFENSKVDFVLTGGDYDFLLLNLARHLEGNAKLEPGIWYRENGEIRSTGQFQLKHDLNSLPFVDRELTRWQLYSENNGNFKKTPGTYTLAGRDCWWHKCTFCSWVTLFPSYRVRSPESVVEEIGILIDRYGVKNVFDDTGTFPSGNWLRKFCRLLIAKGYNKRICLGCNMRFGALSLDDYKLMKKAGFGMLLFGLESANQETLDRIDKGLTTEEIVNSCKNAKKAGLKPHLTIMFGYPWEGEQEAVRTLKLGRFLLTKGYADTVQATVVIPYPGTALFEECKEKGWLKTLDWDHYDMREPVMETQLSDDELKGMVQGIYRVAFSPEFIMRQLLAIRSVADVKFVFKAGWRVLGHIRDFATEKR